MMENYHETCNNNDPIDQLDVICQTNIMNVTNSGQIMSNEENYNFGAEITKVDIVDNNEIKTTKNTIENVISTKTEELTTASLPELSCATATTTIIATIDSEKCDYDTADDIGEDEADDENEDSPDENSSQYAHNTRQNHDGSIDSDDDTSTSTDSDFSDLSGLSDVSGKEWKPVNRKPMLWVQKQMHSGRNPRELLSRFLPAGAQSITLGLNDMSLWRLLANMLAEPPRRQKLRHINTFEDVIQLILNSKNIVVLTGAGVSVSCGIPDFRSSDGIYSRLAKDYPNLPDPQAMFDIDFFSRDPRPFYKFAREIYPGQFKPSPCHRFIKLLEDKKCLLRNYTQNIDTLEQVAGIQRVIECHGSFSTASCTKCKYKCDADAIRADVFAQRIPVCPLCQPHVHQSVDASEPVSEYDLRWLVANGIMKPDIVFFGEGLPDEFHKVMASDKDKCDLLIVIGSSLKVRPVALIPSSLPANVPQILINREQLNHLEFDVELLGDSDVIINQICHRLGDDWKQICFDERVLKESKELQQFPDDGEYEIDDDDVDNDNENDEGTKEDELPDLDSTLVKSSVFIDYDLRATTMTPTPNANCSDSGFESSSTSMGQTECNITVTSTTKTTTTTTNINDDELAQIENIKTSILEFSERPNASDDNDFQPFTVRSGQDTLMTPPTTVNIGSIGNTESLRHLSIDSTKDSGIQCDSSNSMVTNEIACSSSSTLTNGLKTSTNTETMIIKNKTQISSSSDKNIEKDTTTTNNKRRKSKSCSAADFLVDGTYYYYKNSSSYIFPGAQIGWYADDTDTDSVEEDEVEKQQHCQNENEDNEEEEEKKNNIEHNNTIQCDKNETNSNQCNSISPLRIASNDDEIEKINNCKNTKEISLKRYSTENVENVKDKNCIVTSEPPPPIKKCRLSDDDDDDINEIQQTPALPTTQMTDCSDSVTNLNNFETTVKESLETSTTTTTTAATLQTKTETI